MRARKRKKNIRGTSRTSRETGWQDIKVSIRRVETLCTTTSVSRSARVSSRSVALFVNAELRAGARVTGSSRKAPWGFMVPLQLGSEEAREEQQRRRRCPRWGWLTLEGRTVNLVSIGSRQVQGRTVATTIFSLWPAVTFPTKPILFASDHSVRLAEPAVHF